MQKQELLELYYKRNIAIDNVMKVFLQNICELISAYCKYYYSNCNNCNNCNNRIIQNNIDKGNQSCKDFTNKKLIDILIPSENISMYGRVSSNILNVKNI